jgi:hypothetical protein
MRRDLLGHTTTEMTDGYTHSYMQTKQAAVDALVSASEQNETVVPAKVPTMQKQPPKQVAVSH